MQLIVRDPTGTGRRLVCEVASSDTIGSLMEYLETTWAIPISRQRLIFSGKQLEPGRSFEVYNIQTESTLDLVLRRDRIPTVDSTLRRAREIKIFVKLAYQERSFEIAEDATINDLKQEIESVLGIDWLRQRLVCNYKVIRIRDGRLQLNSVPVPSHSHVSVEIITSTPYKVQVRMPDGFSHTVEVIYSEPIAQVKRIITEVTGFPEAEFQLCFENALLSGDDILADCRIDPNSTLDFLSSPAIEEGKEVEILVAYELVDQSEDVVAEYAAPTEAFTIRPSDLVRVLKNQIAASTTIPVHLQEVVHEGTILRDERTFQSYGVKTRHVLQARLLEEEEISIQLKGADGRDIPGIVIKNWLSVADLKREVAGRNGVPDDLDFFEIVLSGAALKDDFALFSCRINSGRKLDIRLRESPPWCDKPFAELEPGNASDKDTPEPDASQLTYRIDRHLHLLADNSAELAKGRWRDLRQLLPEVLRGDIEYKSRGHLSSCWTFTPSEEVSPSDVPLAIAGAPVIIPVDYRYPLMGLLAPPPDPYPFVINPVAPLNMQTVVRIFKTFEHALGFYILINGMLQIVVPEGFDYEWASSYKPNAFGGLKVCYIGESLTPTVDRSEAASETSFNRSIGKAASRSFFSSFRLGQQDRRIGAVPGLKLDQSVEARVKESRAKERHVGRIGIKTCHKSLIYLTMSTHVITSAVTAKQRDRFYQKLLSNSQTQLDANWINKVEIYADDLRIGTVAHTFDAEAKVYPRGFKHDVSLIGPLSAQAVAGITSPVADLGWLSQEGWNNLRRKPDNLRILGYQKLEAKSMPSFGPSQCLIVGEGIFLNRQKLFATTSNERLFQSKKIELDNEELETWKALVSRSILYRVAPDFDSAGGQSGIALYVEGRREDGTAGPGVVGFQSFVQRSGHVQTYDMEGEDLNRRLKRGLVAFYGAFQVPEVMRKEHVIL